MLVCVCVRLVSKHLFGDTSLFHLSLNELLLVFSVILYDVKPSKLEQKAILDLSVKGHRVATNSSSSLEP